MKSHSRRDGESASRRAGDDQSSGCGLRGAGWGRLASRSASGLPTWKSAIQQAWKPALQPLGVTH